jgi:ribosome-binding factor A
MKQGSLRQARVSDLLKETVMEVLLRKIKDPRVHDLTITGLEVSADFRTANVYFCVHGKGQKEEALAGLQSASGFLRHELLGVLDLRRIPELHFIYDESFDYGSHIDELLNNLKVDEGKNS